MRGSRRNRTRTAAILASVLVVASCAQPSEPASAPPISAETTETTEVTGAPGTTAPRVLDAPTSPADRTPADPARLSVPAIGLDEPLIGLGLTESGEMEVPSDFDDVGWFTGGGRPGAIGPTVLAGHVDSTTGPAIFDRLTELVIDDVVTVTTADGTAAQYRVSETGNYPKDGFPTVSVFGATPRDVVRLITCSGDFDASVGSYEENYVVFAERVMPG